jgi:hypothetical protein
VSVKEDDEEEAREAKPVKRRTWGYVTDKASLASCKDFAAEVIPQYFGRAPTEKDRELIFAKCRVLGEDEYNGVAISHWSEEKADLLRYALNAAYAANKIDWRYIDGIWDNFTLLGVFFSLPLLDQRTILRILLAVLRICPFIKTAFLAGADQLI